MADLSFLSDSDESAVEEILSQAMDRSVLEQVAAINCSAFTSDSVLPSHLETRFHRLKSFPAAKPKSPYASTAKKSASSTFNSHPPSVNPLKPQPGNELKNSAVAKPESGLPSDEENGIPSPSNEDPISLKTKSWVSSTSKSSNLSPNKPILCSRPVSFSSPSNSWNSSMESPSPPRSIGCFWCSPKRDSRKKNKENRVVGMGLDWAKKDEFLSDLSTFSTKQQQKMLKKAMKEEDRISREAEKIVNWAKQASARMDVSGLDDELSDNETAK